MKLISLNIWGGRMGEPVLEFFKDHADVDIFLLQEVFQNATERTNWNAKCRSNIFQEIADVLPEHRAYFAPSVMNEWGLAAYVKKSIPIEEIGDFFVHNTMDSLVPNDGSSIGRNLQYLSMMLNGAPIVVVNFHGIWTGNGKDDTEDRINQSRNIIDFLKTLHGEIILCGDFNLNPETKSLNMIAEELGLKNLIKEFSITSTRTSLYTKPGKFADYVLISPKIRVKNFTTLPDEISDHAPLFLEI
jgi:endonuclease/exonuclease/phosphatase family metal-dependent hydrolase